MVVVLSTDQYEWLYKIQQMKATRSILVICKFLPLHVPPLLLHP